MASRSPCTSWTISAALEINRWNQHLDRERNRPSDRCCFRSATACSEKWKTDAARAASARPREDLAEVFDVPAPPEAMTGIETASRHGCGQPAVETGPRCRPDRSRSAGFRRRRGFGFARPLDGVAVRRGLTAAREDPEAPSHSFASMATTTAWLP